MQVPATLACSLAPSFKFPQNWARCGVQSWLGSHSWRSSPLFLPPGFLSAEDTTPIDIHSQLWEIYWATVYGCQWVKGMAEVVPLIEVDSSLVLAYPGFSWGKCKIFCWGRYNQDRPCVVKNHTLLILNTADLNLAGRKRAPTCRRTKHEETVR